MGLARTIVGGVYALLCLGAVLMNVPGSWDDVEGYPLALLWDTQALSK